LLFVLGSWCGSAVCGWEWWWEGLVLTGGVIFKSQRLCCGIWRQFLVWQLMYCCMSVVICFGMGLVLGSWCGSSGVWGGGGYLCMVGFSKECRRLRWGIWYVYHLSGCCSGILHKCENVLMC